MTSDRHHVSFKSWEDLISTDCPAAFTGEQVKAACALAGWTPHEMAKAMGVSKQCIWNWMNFGAPRLSSLAIRFAVVYADVVQPEDV